MQLSGVSASGFISDGAFFLDSLGEAGLAS